MAFATVAIKHFRANLTFYHCSQPLILWYFQRHTQNKAGLHYSIGLLRSQVVKVCIYQHLSGLLNLVPESHAQIFAQVVGSAEIYIELEDGESEVLPEPTPASFIQILMQLYPSQPNFIANFAQNNGITLPLHYGYLFITNPKLDLSFSAMSQGYVAITS